MMMVKSYEEIKFDTGWAVQDLAPFWMAIGRLISSLWEEVLPDEQWSVFGTVEEDCHGSLSMVFFIFSLLP